MLRITDVYASPTVSALAAHICEGAVADPPVDLAREAVLGKDIVACVARARVPARSVLLTGATGFVGRFLLAQLLAESDATVYCLVRAHSKQQAASRLKASLVGWHLWREDFHRRVIAIPGDLRLPRLGIDAPTYEALSRDIDSIYNCATSMNHLETYSAARLANVGSIRELIELAILNRQKLINHISTLGIFGAPASGEQRIVSEDSSIDQEQIPSSHGYVASKWVGEKIVMLAAQAGLACNIFRLGLAWADAEQGRFDKLQNVYRTLKSCLLSGCGIERYRFTMPPTPVDYVARAIVFLANRHPQGGGIFHISSAEQRIDGVFERCNAVADTSLQLMSHYDWICEIKRLHHQGCSLPVVPLIEFAFSMDEQSFYRHQRSRRSAANVRFDLSRTQRELEEAGIVAPALDDDLLRLCLENMLSTDPQLQESRGSQSVPSFARGRAG